MCQSHTGRLTGLWFLSKPAFGLNTNDDDDFFVICLCAVRGVGVASLPLNMTTFTPDLTGAWYNIKPLYTASCMRIVASTNCTAYFNTSQHDTRPFQIKTNTISCRKLSLYKTTSYSSHMYFIYSIFRVKFLYFVAFHFLIISVKSDSIRVQFWSTKWVLTEWFPTTGSTWTQELSSRNCCIFISYSVCLYVPVCLIVTLRYMEVNRSRPSWDRSKDTSSVNFS